MLFADDAPEFTVLPLKLFLTWMKSRLGMGSNQVGVCVCVTREALSEITLLSLFLSLFYFLFLFSFFLFLI